MTTHAPLHGPRHHLHLPHLPGLRLPHLHLPVLRLEHLLFLSLVAGLALFVLEQALHGRRGAEPPPAAAATAPLAPDARAC